MRRGPVQGQLAETDFEKSEEQIVVELGFGGLERQIVGVIGVIGRSDFERDVGESLERCTCSRSHVGAEAAQGCTARRFVA